MIETQELLPIIRQFADRGIQWMLGAPENARGLMSFVAPQICQRLDFHRMTVEPPKFMTEALHLRESDLLLRVPYRSLAGPEAGEVSVLLLTEHQSKPDEEIRLRFLNGQSGVWTYNRQRYDSDHIRQSERRYEPIIPVLVYTGDAPWDIPESIAAQIRAPAELSEFIPHFRILPLKVKATPAGELTGGHPFGWVLRAIQVENDAAQVLESVLLDAVQHLEGLSETDRMSWERALSFLMMLVLHRRDPMEARPIVEKAAATIRPRHEEEATQMARTAAEALIEEGMARGEARGEVRGRSQGIIEAKQEDVLLLMESKFGRLPKRVTAKIRGLQDTEALGALLRRVLDAASLQDMGLTASRGAR